MGKDSIHVTTKEEARAFIEELARRRGTYTNAFKREARAEAKKGREGMLQVIEGSEEVRKNLAMALKIISTDLYTSRARFLMEVIQNADDNKYAKGETPTVSITVFPEYVQIECNEVGFSRENIESLCRAGQSSKAPGQGYTGEKGIGFKSVFNVANRAHIRSPPYYFQLDQTRELGMITPLWDEEFFDDYKKEYQTTIVLDRIGDQLKNFSDTLEEDIKAIVPDLMLFMRRIEKLHLTLFKPSDDKPTISKLFLRKGWTSDSGIVTLKEVNANTTCRLYKHRTNINFEGIEPRRPGIRKTDIVLAFPVKKSGKPYIRKQNLVFAYLPIGDFGFKFVIQADFLTSSNRQSVAEDNLWNKNIAKAIPLAFEKAIDKFNFANEDPEMDKLATMWPLYLHTNTIGQSPYWCSITQSIIKHLSEVSVIKDRIGAVRAPKDLTFLDWAHDRNGEPMFGEMCDYVSSDYPESVREALLSLRVTVPDWGWMCKKLQTLQDEGFLGSRMRNKEWCSDLAKVILEPQEPKGTRKYARDLGRIPLIPLVDGTWRCPPSPNEPIYFPASSGTVIPPGLSLSLVDKKACACPQRRRLFELLGVKNCDVSNVLERIFDYHARFSSAQPVHLIAQLHFLYDMRKHLSSDDMKKIYFVCPASEYLQKGTSVYADISDGGELKQLFSGYSEAHFLHDDYFAKFDDFEKGKLAEWLGQTAYVALVPRLFATGSNRLHEDFEWLLANKNNQVLDTLHQHWSVYKGMTNAAKDRIAGYAFMCKSGRRTALRSTYIPFPKLVEKAQVFGNANSNNFLALPNGEPEDWKFLASLGVGLDEGLDFYLWVMNQPYTNIDKSKQLYLAIQSQAFSPVEEEKVRKAFKKHVISLPKDIHRHLRSCVWRAPKGFSAKPTLRPVYGPELDRLFKTILKVSDATGAEALEYLEQLRGKKSTSMADVTEVYVYLQNPHVNGIFYVNRQTACIAIPSLSGCALEWKTPSQCVWDDAEFSQNGLDLNSKTAIRRTVEQFAPMAKAFFTDVLKLRNANIKELLADLVLTQKNKPNDTDTVYRLYERIETHRRSSSEAIIEAFEEHPIVFIRGINGQSGQWLSLNDCIWTRSVLRDKHALRPSLDQHKGLFRDTLGVPNATVDMIVDELKYGVDEGDEEDYEYVKELVQELARRLRPDEEALQDLEEADFWPCRTPMGSHELWCMGDFYVNDRQDLFDIFSDNHIFLDFDFSTSKTLKNLLLIQGCKSFLSEKVLIETEAREPLERNHSLMRDFRSRAGALLRYFEHEECESPYDLRSLLENAEVWMSADIKTHYTLEDTTVTQSEGGSMVEVSKRKGNVAKLKIVVSANRNIRDCALIEDFPEQLVAALELEPTELPDLHRVLQVPIASLKALLIRKGITDGDAANNYEEASEAESTGQEDLKSASDGIHDTDSDDGSTSFSGSDRSDFAWSRTIDVTRASAKSETANTNLRPYEHPRPRSRPSTPRPRSLDYMNAPPNEIPEEQPDIPLPSTAGLYSMGNRNQNRERVQNFARKVDLGYSSLVQRSNPQTGGSDDAFDMSAIRESLEPTERSTISIPAQVNPSPRRRAAPIPNRNEEGIARDFEVGFLGEQFVYTLLHDTLNLPDFTAEDNWTSSLRSRAGFSTYGREVSDFTYKDTQGALTRHFLEMQHPYTTPEWLYTACDNGNMPLYRIEVKSTTKQNPATTFYMSGRQYKLAKKLRVNSVTPSELYIILRISGLDALEDEAAHRPQWRVYLDPYSRGKEGLLNFVTPTYAVTATA